MNIDGTYTLQAPPEGVWNLLMDVQTLQHTIQGMERLERTGEDTYAFTLHIKHVPLRGSYSGNAVVTKMEYPYVCHMRAEGKGIPGTFHAEWNITLTPNDEYTVVAYQGTLLFSSSHSQLPSPLVKGTIKALIQQFITAVADHLRSTKHLYPIHSEAHARQIEVSQRHNERIEFSTVHEKPSFLHSVVRQLGLGDNDPLLEQQWVNRLRRISIVSMLLILVWVGTRLPRRSGNRQGR